MGKVNISIYNPGYISKCNNKICYICGDPVPEYEKIFCIAKNDPGHNEICPVCPANLPINVPICEKSDCIASLVDSYHEPHSKNLHRIEV